MICTCRAEEDLRFCRGVEKVMLITTNPTCPEHGWKKKDYSNLRQGMDDGFDGWSIPDTFYED